MAVPFNPNEPCVVGAEWFPPFEVGQRLDGPRNGQCAVMTATDTDAAPEVWVAFQSKTGDPAIAVDIYEYGNYDESDTTTGIHRPTQDVRNINGYAWGAFAPAGTQTNIYRGIDSPTLTPGTWPNTGEPVTNNEFIFPIFGSGYEVTFRYGGIVGVYTGRICTVTLRAKVNLFVDSELIKGMRVTPYLKIDGQRYFGASKAFSSTAKAGHDLTASWDYNPVTGGPWTIADVEQFDAVGGSDSAGWIVDATGSSNNLATILQGWVEITESTPDNRVGAGVFHGVGAYNADVERGWNEAYMTMPWNKLAGTTYVLHFFRSSGTGSVGLRRLAARDAEPGDHNGHTVATPIYFTRTDRLASIDETDQRGHAISLVVTNGAGVPQTDSQPYESVGGDFNYDCGANNPWTTMLTQFEQLMTPSASASFGFARILLRTTDGAPPGDLTVGIYRESDDLLMSSLETITLGDLTDPTFDAQGWQVVEVEFATPASLVAATQYYVSIDDGGAGGWEVQVLSCGIINKVPPCGPPIGSQDTKWGGATDPLRINGTDEDALTACVTIHQLGPALSTFTVSTRTATDPTNACDLPLGDCVQYAHLEWSLPEFGDCLPDFVEVQRSDDGGATWDVIAREYTGEVFQFDDYESKRNTVTWYRARLRMIGGGVGVMSAGVSVTVAAPCCGLIFASNLLPSLAAFYVDTGDARSYEFVEHVEELEFQNRDYAVEVHELAYRGDRFTVNLAIGSGSPTPSLGVNTVSSPGRSAFDALLAAVRPNRGATVPYIAVMNENGDRWFASIRTPGGKVTLNRLHEAKATIREVTNKPYAVSILDVPAAS